MKNLNEMNDIQLRDYRWEIKEAFNRAAVPTSAFTRHDPVVCDELLGVMREITRETWRRNKNLAPVADDLDDITARLEKSRAQLAELEGSWRVDKIYSMRLRIQEYEDKIAWVNGELK